MARAATAVRPWWTSRHIYEDATASFMSSGNELPDHLPLFLEFLSQIRPLGTRHSELLEAKRAHIVAGLADPLCRRQSSYKVPYSSHVLLRPLQLEACQAAD